MDPITLVILIAAGAIFGSYVVIKPFRTQVNTLFYTVWNKLFGKLISPIDQQKKMYADAIEALKKAKASVVSIMASAKLAHDSLTTKITAVETARKAYNNAKSLIPEGPNKQAALDELALRFDTAKNAVTAQTEIVTKADAASDRARKTLEETTENVKKFGTQIQTNEGKLELANALKIGTHARELSQSVNDTLSAAGQATASIDKTLAEAEAGEQLSNGNATDQLLRDAEKSASAAAARAELDGTATSSGQATINVPTETRVETGTGTKL